MGWFSGLTERGRSASIYIETCLTKGWMVVLAGFLLVVLLTTSWSNEYIQSFLIDGFDGGNSVRWHNRHGSEPQGTPITLSCPTTSAQPAACSSPNSIAPSPAPSSVDAKSKFSSIPTPSCPDFFQYIHEDLKPWINTGITKEMVESARQHANVNFRLAIIGGRVYLEQYSRAFQTRDVFTIWGILQLVNRYPGRVPDLEIMFNCDDPPAIKADDFRTTPPPPLFRYCKDGATLDIVFPDWSFWGWPEVNLKPWEQFLEEIGDESRKLKWKNREPYAYWKGNSGVAWTRGDLMRCNISNGEEYNARLFSQNWEAEQKNGFRSSNMAKQCIYRYKIYIEGRSWSVSEKYILACNSPMLLVTTPFNDFFTRGLVPGRHYWPIRPDKKCKSIKYAVNWGNRHQREAQKMGRAGSLFTQEELSMENVYDYMLHLLTAYAKLLRYKPTVPEKAKEICMESMACSETGLIKEFLLDSMVKSTYDFEPCLMPPPFKTGELDAIARKKDEYLRKVALREDGLMP
ncbi:O-glucosyltransferase rumi-like protein (DUF821) [Rhynchospora pubera]|uniref:O-glucosyltransferase rumi-like protein (DUF821) n=1 Tax=Rhynchospora pubera TaxID=906938 RepID=A0AAV8EWM0_9POAL|nr:O-glucosyltransferase rumi-like protein (DUF821) [Rhynchospora pubera]